MARTAIRVDFNAPPPRSAYFKDIVIINEGNVIIGDNRYLMRQFEGGGAELVRFDHKGGKWAVLCFPGTEGEALAAGV